MNAPVVPAPALKPPSARQRDVLDFIVAYRRECGYPPTLREIGAALNVRSTNGITDHLRALERKGYLTHGAMLSRGLRLTAAAVAEYDAHEAPPAPCAPASPIPSHQLVAWLVARALDAGVVPFSQMRAALGADDAEVRELTAQGRAIDDAMRATPTAEGTPT